MRTANPIILAMRFTSLARDCRPKARKSRFGGGLWDRSAGRPDCGPCIDSEILGGLRWNSAVLVEFRSRRCGLGDPRGRSSRHPVWQIRSGVRRRGSRSLVESINCCGSRSGWIPCSASGIGDAVTSIRGRLPEENRPRGVRLGIAFIGNPLAPLATPFLRHRSGPNLAQMAKDEKSHRPISIYVVYLILEGEFATIDCAK